jgi:hypothetical protein
LFERRRPLPKGGANGSTFRGKLSPPPSLTRPTQESGKRRFSDVGKVWESARHLRGTPVEEYLKHRGCWIPPDSEALRYIPPSTKYPHTMVALVRNAYDGEPMTLHFTELVRDGNGNWVRDKRRFASGLPKAGGVVCLTPFEDVSEGLAIGEGIETCLCAARVFQPMWAALDAGNLRSLPVLEGVECLTIFADHDSAGMGALMECADRWTAAGRTVHQSCPRTPGYDAADEVAA